MAAKNTTAEIRSSLEQVNISLGNLAELIIGQRSLFENLSSQVETNRIDQQRQLDTLKRRVDTLFEMVTEALGIARNASDMAREANEMSRESIANINLSRDLAGHSRELLALAQQQLEDMRLELALIRGDGEVRP